MKIPRPSRSDLLRQTLGAEPSASTDSVSIDVSALSTDEGYPQDVDGQLEDKNYSQAHCSQETDVAQSAVNVPKCSGDDSS